MPDFKPIEHARYFIHGPRQFKPNRIPFRQCRDLFSSILFTTYFFIIHSCIPVIPEQPFKSIRVTSCDTAVKKIRFDFERGRGIFFPWKNLPQGDLLRKERQFFTNTVVRNKLWNKKISSTKLTRPLNQQKFFFDRIYRYKWQIVLDYQLNCYEVHKFEKYLHLNTAIWISYCITLKDDINQA